MEKIKGTDKHIPECNVDDILDKLNSAKNSKIQKPVNLLENEIKWLTIKMKEICLDQPIFFRIRVSFKCLW